MLQTRIFLHAQVSLEGMDFPNYSPLNPHLLRLHENPFFPRISGESQEFRRCFPISLRRQVSRHLAQDRRATRSVRGRRWRFCESPPLPLKLPLGRVRFPLFLSLPYMVTVTSLYRVVGAGRRTRTP